MSFYQPPADVQSDGKMQRHLSPPPVIRQILKGYEEGRVTREEMETAAGHLLCMIRRIHGKEK
jgi:hypothetical protein